MHEQTAVAVLSQGMRVSVLLVVHCGWHLNRRQKDRSSSMVWCQCGGMSRQEHTYQAGFRNVDVV
jgi:hypothetical protein